MREKDGICFIKLFVKILEWLEGHNDFSSQAMRTAHNNIDGYTENLLAREKYKTNEHVGLMVRECAPHAAGPGFESWRRCYHSLLMVQTTSLHGLDSRSR